MPRFANIGERAPGMAHGRRLAGDGLLAVYRPEYVRGTIAGVLVTERPIFRADRATAENIWHASQEPRVVSSEPAHPEGDEVVWAIDRWNNEGGFVPDVDAGLDSWRRRRRPSSGG